MICTPFSSRPACTLLACALAVHSSWARADTPDEQELALVYGHNANISLASGHSQPLRRAPAVATVITAADIAALGARDLDEVLATVPGLQVQRGASIYVPVYVMRGIGGGGTTNPQMLMLQDGAPMTIHYTGDRGNSWGSYPVTHIARIEIIRGPGSALYGAEAFAGVINIISKDAAQLDGWSAGLQAGSFASRDAWLSFGDNRGPVTVAAWLQVGSTRGSRQRIEADAQTLNDSRFGTHVSLAPGPMPNGHDAVDADLALSRGQWRWHANIKARDKIGLGPGVNQALDPTHNSKSIRVASELAWSAPAWAEHWSLGAQLNALNYTEESIGGLALFPPGTRIGPSFFPDGMIGGPSRSERTIGLSAFAIYSGMRGHTLRFGAGHENQHLYRATTFKNFLLSPAGLPIPTGPVIDYGGIQPHILPLMRKLDYVYVQDEWQLAPDWNLTAGVRHDRYSAVGSTTNPRVALVWDTSLALTTKLLMGRAFRPPSFSESYGINPVNISNPNLRPETISSTELAWTWQATGQLSARLNLFQLRLDDLIRSVVNPAPAPGSTFRNIGKVKARGGEVELVWEASPALRLLANYARQHAHDQANGRDPGYGPRHKAFARADWQLTPAMQFTPQLNWVAGRLRALGDARTPIANYLIVDASWTLRDGKQRWNLQLRNLNNADAREPSQAPGLALPFDMPSQPRSVSLQWTLDL